MAHDPWMIYGANGYTGKLLAELAVEKGLHPLLAGRSESKIRPIAEKLGLEYRAFDLGDPMAAAKGIKEVDLVMHCAGPFSATSAPMVEACLKTGTHYLDITGEIEVFEAIHARTQEAKKSGSVLMPGVGFDVVPSDCLAASLARALPDATELELALGGFGTASAGTAKTAVEGLPKGGRIRKNGRIIKVPTGHKAKEIQFSDKPRWCMAIPWGDVSTAYYSTGIPNITVYTSVPRAMSTMTRLSAPFMGVTALPAVQNFLKNQIEKRVKGLDEKLRRTGRVHLWGQVKNDAGKVVTGTLDCPEGYRFTVLSAMASVERVLAGEVPGGAWTPSAAFGADFVTRLPETDLRVPT